MSFNARTQNNKSNTTHFLTMTVVGWIDVFTRDEYRQVIIESLKYCQEEKGLEINAYVIMTNHLHIICRAEEGSDGLSAIIRDFKKYTAKKIINMIEESKTESKKEWTLKLFEYYAKKNKTITLSILATWK
ncbi:MAG: transposase [Saprospiraceae bacterium]